MNTDMIIALIVSFMISYFSMPHVIKLAHKIGAIDVPKDARRVHTKPIPRLGGLAIFGAFAATSLIFIDKMDFKYIGIMLGSMIIVASGMLDDLYNIRPKYKLLAQITASLVVIGFGIRVDFLTNPFDTVDGMMYLGYFGIPLTVFWIVGITNTVNLIDGLDGLAAGVSAISATTMIFVAYSNEQYMAALLLTMVVGGALGFLPYNFNPAKIFMGDTGSLFLGFILATISVEGVMKSKAALSMAIPIFAIGLPIFDTSTAMIRRYINKKPIMEADKGHLHHRLLSKGLSQRQTVLILYAISILIGGSAILLYESNIYESMFVVAVNMVFLYYMIIRLKLFSVE